METYGLTVMNNNCAPFQILVKNKTWDTIDSGLCCKENLVLYVDLGETLRYVGVDINP
jgi:hypothetical protein